MVFLKSLRQPWPNGNQTCLLKSLVVPSEIEGSIMDVYLGLYQTYVMRQQNFQK